MALKNQMTGTIIREKDLKGISLDDFKTKLYGSKGSKKRDDFDARIAVMIAEEKFKAERSKKLWNKLKDLTYLGPGKSKNLFNWIERNYK